MHADREDEDGVFFDTKGEAVVVIDSGFKTFDSNHFFSMQGWIIKVLKKKTNLFVQLFDNKR